MSRIRGRLTQYQALLLHNSGDLAAFWMSYVDLVELLLTLIRASRDGNWLLNFHSIHLLIPFCLAYDRQNYARFLPIYYAEMTRLLEDDTGVFGYCQIWDLVTTTLLVEYMLIRPYRRQSIDLHRLLEELFRLKPGTVCKFLCQPC